MLGELISQAMDAAQEAGVSDIHLSTHSGLHFRYRGELTSPELEPYQQAAIDAMMKQDEGGGDLISGLIEVIAPGGRLGLAAHRHLMESLEGFHSKWRRGD